MALLFSAVKATAKYQEVEFLVGGIPIRNYFEVIEFAVYCSPRDERNYTTFKRILGEG